MEREELIKLINDNLIDSIEARELLGCSRQYISELVKKKKLIPVKKQDRKYTLFLKSDVLKFKK